MSDLSITLYKGKDKISIRQPMEVEIMQEVNRIPFARLVYHDGNPAEENFPLSASAHFVPWEKMDIWIERISFETPALPAFRGIVTRHSLEGSAKGYSRGSHLVVELHSATYKMSLQSRTRVFQAMTDADIFRQIIQEYGFTPGNIATTPAKHKEIVQYACSDWDFMLSRVDANGLWLMVNPDANGNETIDIIEPVFKGNQPHKFVYGVVTNGKTGIRSFEMQADLSGQYDTIQSVGWNHVDQKATKTAQANAFNLAQSNLLNNGASQQTATLQSAATNDEAELQAWADAAMRKSRMAMIRGRLQVAGHSKYLLNNLIELFGLSDRFNGKTLITGVRHQVSSTGWQTDIQFGMSEESHVGKFQLQNAAANNMLPGIQGLHIGKVSGYKNDAEHRLMVQVIIPGIHITDGEIWARLATPYAGKNHHFMFRPEIGDEVILGFLNNDPRFAYILGAMHSEENFPGLAPADLAPVNDIKGWVTREGLQLLIDEANKEIAIIAKDIKANTEQAIKISYKTGSAGICLSDSFGNKITMYDQGIKIESLKNIVIQGSMVDIQ